MIETRPQSNEQVQLQWTPSTYAFKRQSHKMVKHTQTSRQIADELFECVKPFCEIGA